MSEAKLTPMMEHYNRVKAENPDCILFYRVGDFFELFKEDAVKAAAILNIQLTTRGSSTKMAGVPAHALEPYVQKLVNSGERVALVDQLETPEEARARGGQGTMIERGLVRIYTAATITEDELISAAANNFLASVERADGKSVAYQIALVDISTLEIELMAPTADLYSAIAIKNPAEILIDTEILNDPALADFVANFKERLVVRPSLGLEIADGNLQKYFGAVVGDHFTSLEKQAIAKAISYIEMTQIGAAPKFRFPTRTGGNGTMEIDAFSMSNLEVLRAATPNGKSLFDVIDFTKTAKGKRLLASRLQTPLTDPAAINARLDDVAQFAGNAKLAKDTLDILAQTSDLERIMARVEFGRANARDLLAAQASILFAPTLQDLLRDTKYKLSAPLEVAKKIRGAVINPAESENKSSEIIKEGYSAELDNLRRLSTDTKKVIAELQARYAAETGINTLRIKYVGTTGYSVEVPNQKASVLMENKLFSHRQSLVNAVRFTTAELMELDAKIASAGEKANALERELFTALVGELKSESETIATYAATLAELDVSAGLGLAAAKNNWTRPMVDTSLAFDISAGRHPVVEDALKSRQNQFIPNSAKIEGSEKIWLLTGPNMAG
ncbi:MAG: DNA mismatch repair protein MutS, partial [Alphaproteobacteria bacterium]|nr:DNA mismatch repair protein MutS [Alphaproteobacteria bacterium]